MLYTHFTIGYHNMNKKNRCKPKCVPECINGLCMHPNECMCFERYNVVPGKPYKCERECDRPCVNGYCNNDFECECYSGYHFKEDSFYECFKDNNAPEKFKRFSFRTLFIIIPIILLIIGCSIIMYVIKHYPFRRLPNTRNVNTIPIDVGTTLTIFDIV